MAVIAVKNPVQPEQIRVSPVCPECGGSKRITLKGPVTRKNCPMCNRVTYVFTITPLRGFIQITATWTGATNTPVEYDVDSNSVEID